MSNIRNTNGIFASLGRDSEKPLIPTARNHSIDVVRLIAALYIVLNHSKGLLFLPEPLYQYFSQFGVRFTAPFFLIVSGYYYIRALRSGKKVFWKQFKTILLIYVFWTIIYYAGSFVQNIIIENMPLGEFFSERIVFFFVDGSYYHLWYLLAFLYSMAAVTLIWNLFRDRGLLIFAVISFVFYLIGAFGNAYYEIGKNIPVLSAIYKWGSFDAVCRIPSIGFAFFSGGYWLILMQKKIDKAKTSTCWLIFSIASLLYLAEIALLVFVLKWTQSPEVFLTTYIFTIPLFIVLLKHPAPRWAGISKYSQKSATLTYFMHPLVLLMLAFVLGENQIHPVLVFGITAGVCLVTSYVLYKWDSGFSKLLFGERFKRNNKRKAA